MGVDQGQSFDFSQYTFEAGSNVAFEFVAPEGQAPGAAATWVGTSNGDRFLLGDHTLTVSGGGGADSFVPEGGNATILDFTIDEDFIDLSDSGITGGQRLADFASQVGADVVIEGDSGGHHTRLVINNVALGDLIDRGVHYSTGGTPVFETGGDTADLLFGFGFNDELHGGDGNDRIYGGGGIDKLYGDAGDDTIILDGAVPSLPQGSVIDGGIGFDTLVLRNTAGQPTALGTPLTIYQITFPSTIISIEALRFESAVGTQIQFIALKPTLVSAGLTALTGGAGRDVMVEVVFSAGDYTVSNYQLNNWTSNIFDTNSDIIALVASPNSTGNFTLNAREGLASTQSLIGAAGNDLLIGSSGSDFLDGRGGVNVLHGMGGNDSLIVSNLTPFGGTLTTRTYAGSLFDGGDGIDALSVNGVVQFQGSLQNIERLYFNPAFVATAPGQIGQAAANLVVSGATLNQLPGDLGLFGDGTLTVNLQTGEAYNGSGYTALFGFNPLIDVHGTAIDDIITVGAVRETVNGGTGGVRGQSRGLYRRGWRGRCSTHRRRQPD